MLVQLAVEVFLTLCTALCTVFVIFSTRRAEKHAEDAEGAAHMVKTDRILVGALQETMSRFDTRLRRLNGVVARERRGAYDDEPDPDNSREPDIDPEVAALLALQNASKQP